MEFLAFLDSLSPLPTLLSSEEHRQVLEMPGFLLDKLRFISRLGRAAISAHNGLCMQRQNMHKQQDPVAGVETIHRRPAEKQHIHSSDLDEEKSWRGGTSSLGPSIRRRSTSPLHRRKSTLSVELDCYAQVLEEFGQQQSVHRPTSSFGATY